MKGRGRSIVLIVILLVPVALAITAGFEPMKETVTYSWGNSIIISEVKSFTVNPPLILFLGALVYGLFRNNLAFCAAPAVSFLYTFLMLWLVWSGARGELSGAFYYAVIFAFIGLVGAVIAYLVYSIFKKIFIKKST